MPAASTCAAVCWNSEARELNIGFVSRMVRGRPWVRLKVAASLDGRTALPDGRSQWITGEAARADGHAWRARACAVLTGIGTVRDDDPQLTVRHVQTSRQPLRVLVDSRLEVNPAARILEGGGTLVVCALDQAARDAKTAVLNELRLRGDHAADAQRQGRPAGAAARTRRAATSTNCTSRPATGSTGRCCAKTASTSCWSTWRRRCSATRWDWPIWPPPEALDERLVLHWQSVDRIGDDLRLVARLTERT